MKKELIPVIHQIRNRIRNAKHMLKFHESAYHDIELPVARDIRNTIMNLKRSIMK